MAQWIEHQTSNLGVAGSSPARGMITFSQPSLAVRSGSLVVMTSALHAEGRGFNPRPEYLFKVFFVVFLFSNLWGGRQEVRGALSLCPGV